LEQIYPKRIVKIAEKVERLGTNDKVESH